MITKGLYPFTIATKPYDNTYMADKNIFATPSMVLNRRVYERFKQKVKRGDRSRIMTRLLELYLDGHIGTITLPERIRTQPAKVI